MQTAGGFGVPVSVLLICFINIYLGQTASEPEMKALLTHTHTYILPVNNVPSLLEVDRPHRVCFNVARNCLTKGFFN